MQGGCLKARQESPFVEKKMPSRRKGSRSTYLLERKRGDGKGNVVPVDGISSYLVIGERKGTPKGELS